MAGLRSRFAPPPLHFLLVSFRLVLRGTLYVLCYVPVCACVCGSGGGGGGGV